MFWILINHKLADNERFTDGDMFRKYWVKYQLYVEWQKMIMEQMKKMHEWTWRMVWVDATWLILAREFWELNFAKYLYLMNRDREIIRRFADAFYEEMFKNMWEEIVAYKDLPMITQKNL